MGLNEYVQALRQALKCPGARAFYFPPGKAKRKERVLRLAREFAFGLADYPPKDVNDIMGSLYGQLVVEHSFDSTGVVVDAKEWVTEIREHLPALPI